MLIFENHSQSKVVHDKVVRIQCFLNVFNSQQTPRKTIRKWKEATLLRSPRRCPRSPPTPAGTWCSGWPPAASPLCSAACPWFRWAGGRVVWRIPGSRTSLAGVPAHCASGWKRARMDIRRHRSCRGTAAGTTAVTRPHSTSRRRLAAPHGSGIRTAAASDPADLSGHRSLGNHQRAHNTYCSCPNGNESPGGMRPCWECRVAIGVVRS